MTTMERIQADVRASMKRQQRLIREARESRRVLDRAFETEDAMMAESGLAEFAEMLAREDKRRGR